MLEKMGWTKGKGLGANLDGELNFVRIKHKDDNKGMGFHDRDDQWTQHEQNFNALLKSFETADDEASADKPTVVDITDPEEAPSCQGFGFQAAASAATPLITKETVFSGVSLEEQSKKSSKRVHYKKFTRGKDMARYSEQDLANIFGKKALNDQHKFVPVEAFTADDEDDDAEKKPTVPTEEHVFGVTVIKTGTTVTDYFKAKMDALRLKRQGPNNEGASNPFYVYNPDKVKLNFQPEAAEEIATVVTEVNDVTTDEVVHKKAKKSKKSKAEKCDQETTVVEEPSGSVGKKSMKAKTPKVECETTVEETVNIESTLIAEDVVPPKKKKSKKSKRQDDHENPSDQIDFVISKRPQLENPDDENAEIPSIASPDIKKSKKRKCTEVADVEDAETVQKQPKRTALTEEPINIADVVDVDTSVKSKTKKSKKHKKQRGSDDTENTDLAADEATQETKHTSKVISTQPLHFPKFISNVLTSLYDPNVAADDAGNTLASESAIVPAPQPATPSATATFSSTAGCTVLSDTFELAKYKAEVFRFFDLDGFAGSTLGDIVGYGYGRNLHLKVVTAFRDDQRITNFWDQALMNKYGANVIQAKKVTKKKKYNVNVLSKKNVFKFYSK